MARVLAVAVTSRQLCLFVVSHKVKACPRPFPDNRLSEASGGCLDFTLVGIIAYQKGLPFCYQKVPLSAMMVL